MKTLIVCGNRQGDQPTNQETRSPIELFWTVKKRKQSHIDQIHIIFIFCPSQAWIWRYCLIIFNFSYLPVVFEFCIILHLYLISANCQYRCMSILHYENLTCSQSREGKSRSADCQLKMVRHKSRGRVVREGLQCQALPKSWHCQKGARGGGSDPCQDFSGEFELQYS